MPIDPNYIQALQDKLNIETLVSSYVSLKRAGKNLKGLCPFHNEKTPSFTVYPENDSFYCFGCGAGGDALTFIRRIENLDYTEAVKFAAEMVGMPLPEDKFDDSYIKLKRRILSANRDAARFFHSCLMEEKNKAALQYFLNRKLTPATIKHFGLGYAPDSWDDLMIHMKSLGYTESELLQANLIRKSESGKIYDNFRNRVMFPIIDLRGNIIAFGGRVLDDSKPKYVNTSDTPVYKKSNGVFAMNFAKNNNNGVFLLVEGYMDVIALHQAGFTNAIACLGTAFTTEQANLLARYANEIKVCYDNDEAGKKATQRAISILGTTGLKVSVVSMTGGKDADEIIRTYGPEKFSSILKSAANTIEYKILEERSKYDISSDDGKVKFMSAACKILASSTPVESDVYATRLSNELNIDVGAIKAQINTERIFLKKEESKREQQRTNELIEKSFEDKSNPERKSNLRAARAEETLIASLMRNPDFYAKLKDQFTPEDFVTTFNKRIIESVIDMIEYGLIPDLTIISRDFSVEEMDSVTRIYNSGRNLSNTLKECQDCIAILKSSRTSEINDPSKLSDEEFLAQIAKKKGNK